MNIECSATDFSIEKLDMEMGTLIFEVITPPERTVEY